MYHRTRDALIPFVTSTVDFEASAEERDPLAAKFPSVPYPTAVPFCSEYFGESARAAASIDPVALDRAASVLLATYTSGATVFSCGNGGSASIANHLQCDHMKGVRTHTDLMPRVVSLSSNVEILTAIANDIGYEDVFTYQLQSQSRPGDALVAISSSGRSPNIVRALLWAREHGLRTIALTGFEGGESRRVAEVAIHVNCANYGVIEDLHQAVMHALAQYIRQSRMTSGTILTTTF
jgi:phosphoheptose isomerase